MTHERVLSNVGTRGSASRNNGGRMSGILVPGEKETVISVEQPGENGADAEMVTVTLGPISQVEGPANTGSPRFKCILEWGADGANQSCEIDWINGVQVSVPAGCLRVVAVNETVDPGAGPISGAVSAHVGYGTRGGVSAPTRTLTGAPGVPVAIPAMATNTTALGAGTFSFLDAYQAVIVSGLSANTDFRIPGSAAYVVSAATKAFVFGLSL